jgi:hypothetical protein
LKSHEQGIGKTTGTEFIGKYVVGSKLWYNGGSQPLVSQFNYILLGKLFVVYEELETFSTGQWTAVSCRLKRDCTSDIGQYEQKGIDVITAKNINNYVINTNVNALKDDDGRRIMMTDLSNIYKGKVEFFNQLYRDCMNMETGEAFYNYLMEIDLTNYNDQKFPESIAKQDSIVQRLDSVTLFLKERYVLQKIGFKTNLKSFYIDYVDFCNGRNKKPETKIDFGKKLATMDIKPYSSGKDTNFYKKDYEFLHKLFTDKKWLHDTDDIIQDECTEEHDEEKSYLKKEIEQWQKKDLISTQRIAQLELLVEELRANGNNTTFQEIDDISETIIDEIDDLETFVSETLVESDDDIDSDSSDNESDYDSGSDDGLSIFGEKKMK